MKIRVLLLSLIVLSLTIKFAQAEPLKGVLTPPNAEGKQHIITDDGKKMEILQGEELARLFIQFGDGNAEKGDYETAFSYYTNALSVLINNGIFTSETNFVVFMKFKELEEKTEFRLKPGDDRNLNFNVANAYSLAAVHSLKNDDPEQARYLMEKCIEFLPDHAPSYANLGAALDLLGRFPEAIEAYQKGLTLDPDSALLYYNMACSYSMQKNAAESIRNLKLSIEKGFDDFELIKSDPTLKYIRDMPEFQELMKGH